MLEVGTAGTITRSERQALENLEVLLYRHNQYSKYICFMVRYPRHKNSPKHVKNDQGIGIDVPAQSARQNAWAVYVKGAHTAVGIFGVQFWAPAQRAKSSILL